LPECWTSSSQIIDAAFNVQAVTTAVHVLQDYLGNSCSEFVKNRSGAH